MTHAPYVIERDAQGWLIFRRWGIWRLTVNPTDGHIVLDEPKGYWITSDRWQESDWSAHMSRKGWCLDHIPDLERALAFCRALTVREKTTLAAFAMLANKFGGVS